MANFSDKEAEILNRLTELANRKAASKPTQIPLDTTVPAFNYQNQPIGNAQANAAAYKQATGEDLPPAFGPTGPMELPRNSKPLPPKNNASAGYPISPLGEMGITAQRDKSFEQSSLSQEEQDYLKRQYGDDFFNTVSNNPESVISDNDADTNNESSSEESPRDKVRNQVMEKYGIKPSMPTEEDLKRAQKNRAIGNLIADLGDASSTFLEGSGGKDQSQFYQNIRERDPVKAVEEKMSLAREYDKKEGEDLDKEAKRFELETAKDAEKFKDSFKDVSSPISKAYQDLAIKVAKTYGIPFEESDLRGQSAAQISEYLKTNTPYAQLFQSEKNNARQAAIDAMKKAEKTDKDSLKNDRDWQKERRQWVYNTTNKIQQSEDVKKLGKIFEQRTILQNAASNPNAFNDIASVFAFMKSIDPESVVRESEFANAAGAGSLLTNWKNKWSKMTTGQMLQSDQRQELLKLADLMYKAAQSRYSKNIEPRVRQAVGTYNVHPSLILPSFPEDMLNNISKDLGSDPVSLDKSLSPGEINKPKEETTIETKVRVKDPQGNIRLIPENMVDAAIKAGGERL